MRITQQHRGNAIRQGACPELSRGLPYDPHESTPESGGPNK